MATNEIYVSELLFPDSDALYNFLEYARVQYLKKLNEFTKPSYQEDYDTFPLRLKELIMFHI